MTGMKEEMITSCAISNIDSMGDLIMADKCHYHMCTKLKM